MTYKLKLAYNRQIPLPFGSPYKSWHDYTKHYYSAENCKIGLGYSAILSLKNIGDKILKHCEKNIDKIVYWCDLDHLKQAPLDVPSFPVSTRKAAPFQSRNEYYTDKAHYAQY